MNEKSNTRRPSRLAALVLGLSLLASLWGRGYAQIIDIEAVKREGELVTISFNMLLNPEFLHHVLRLSFET